MAWHRWLEVVVIVVFAGGTLLAGVLAVTAVIQGARKVKAAQAAIPTANRGDAGVQSEEHKALVAEHWRRWRERMAGLASDINLLAGPYRRDAIELIKESANWGRLGIQYAIIVNAGALAALPYLLNQATSHKIAVGDAAWSAGWFATGLIAAALCCLVAYLDFQIGSQMHWTNYDMECRAARQRHFEGDEQLPLDSHTLRITVLQATNTRTSLCGVALAVIAWLAFAVGALRLIYSMAP